MSLIQHKVTYNRSTWSLEHAAMTCTHEQTLHHYGWDSNYLKLSYPTSLSAFSPSGNNINLKPRIHNYQKKYHLMITNPEVYAQSNPLNVHWFPWDQTKDSDKLISMNTFQIVFIRNGSGGSCNTYVACLRLLEIHQPHCCSHPSWFVGGSDCSLFQFAGLQAVAWYSHP